MDATEAGRRRFPTTRWTLILASRRDEEGRRAALEDLLACYWKPLYFYFRRKGLLPEAAEDAVQGLFLHLLERDFLDRLDPARGRFRGFLKTSADHYLANLREREAARKRGGGLRFVPLDLALAERELASTPENAEQAFDREWALGLMQRALAELRRDYEVGRRQRGMESVLRFFALDRAPSYAEAAAECGMSVPQFKATLHRARVRFREILRREVAETVEDAHRADEEMAELVRLLCA